MAKVKTIVPAEKVKLTAGRIADFRCPKGKAQTFLWSNDPLGLAVRATAPGPKSPGAKAFIYQAKVNRKSMRVTIGDVSKWSIAKAEAEALALAQTQARDTVTVSEAWQAYVQRPERIG